MNETGEFSTLLREGPPSGGANAAFMLSVVEGPDVGAALVVDPSLPCRVFVGNSPTCELSLTDGEVSRRHLALEASGQRLRVTDLGSSSGTTADGVLVVEAFLRGGELLRLGRTAVTVERRELVPSPTARVSRSERFGRIVGASPEMQRLYPLSARLAATNVPVLVQGEPGTGKEALAEALHEHGPRAEGPFVVFDCTAVPPALAESELFGHEHGAFLGAASMRKGAFEQARGGTLLIDEIGDLDPSLQWKLLQALERSEIIRIGGSDPIEVDVRTIFTTPRDLDRMVEAGRLRDDLLDRISVARIELPPLRRRTGDVRRLALHFARDIGGPAATIPPDLVAQWEIDPWPGNVRALRDAVARWLALGDLAVEMTSRGSAPPRATGEPPTPDALFEEVLAMQLPLVQARERVVAELERRYVERVLADHGGSVARAAEASGLARRRFQRIEARGDGGD